MRRSLKRSDFTRYANLMLFWSDYIHYFVHILLKLSLTLNFNVSFIYYFIFNRMIKCGEKVWFVLAQFIWGRSTVCKFRSLWTKNNCRKKACYFTLILFLTSQPLIFRIGCIQQFRFWQQVWVWQTQLWISNFNSENFSFVVKIWRHIRHANYSRQPSTPKIIDTRLNIGPSVGMTSKPFEFSNV